ncbi:MAG TPA: hypothetical protein VNE59_10700 [Burkholderiales bacterium]|nr:hypothetical protein [Burkholderiales bacterium]
MLEERAAQLESAGVTADMVRPSIGIEHVDGIVEDVDQALAAASRGQRPMKRLRMRARRHPRPPAAARVQMLLEPKIASTSDPFP